MKSGGWNFDYVDGLSRLDLREIYEQFIAGRSEAKSKAEPQRQVDPAKEHSKQVEAGDRMRKASAELSCIDTGIKLFCR